MKHEGLGKRKKHGIFEKKLFNKKKRIEQMRRDTKRVNIRSVRKRRGNMKRVKIRRKRNEKNIDRNEEDKKRKFEQGVFVSEKKHQKLGK